MARHTIWRKGSIVGTYPGATEAEALDALARDEGDADFTASCAKRKLKRDDYKVQEVEEG